MKKRVGLFLVALTGTLAFVPVAQGAQISAVKGKIILRAGILERTLDLGRGRGITGTISVKGKPTGSAPVPELLLTVWRGEPNRRPDAFKPGVGGEFESNKTFDKILTPEFLDDKLLGQTVAWVEPIALNGAELAAAFGPATHAITTETDGRKELTVRISAKPDGPLRGLTIELLYTLYDEHPVIRKRVVIHNGGSRWLKLDQLTIEPLDFSKLLPVRTPLTPADYGAQSSVVAFASSDESRGLITASEIPSGLRAISNAGAMGYTQGWFEWVLGPGETFTSEPVFLYAFSGEVYPTASALSRPLDRALEGPYMRFLGQRIGIAADAAPLEVPIWISWAQFGPDISDRLIRQQADVAAKAGFVMFQLDDGWQRGRLGTEPDTDKFPDIEQTWRYIRSQGLKLGLWLSSIRDAESKDLKAVPDGRSVPLVKRSQGHCMAFASPWREYYVDDLVSLHQRWGVDYYKQDFSNPIYGDVAAGHEGRTLRDSILRSLRRLLEAQDEICRRAPNLILELTHEIYWNTPGVGGDLAVLEHAARYHMSPNYLTGLPPTGSQRKSVEEIRKELVNNCFVSRQRFFENRGLPLYPLEFYGAATASYQGSLTSEIQDRQIVSWLMGAPSVYSGDLASLSEENVARYRERFKLLKRLQADYDFFRYFQFSGVPAPTDADWHWWGKLSPKGGAVVVVRGRGGQDERKINIPWADARRKYQLTALFANRPLGTFTGKQLQSGSLALNLPRLGQEILEVKPLGKGS
jgi:hypothetical protein